MRKLLSILASVGLVATASTSVVSCTKKDKTPTYHSVEDIKKDLTGENKLISFKDIQSLTAKDSNAHIAKQHVIGTIATGFKNPKDLIDDFNNGKIDVDLKGKNSNISDESTNYLVSIDQLGAKDAKGNPTVVTSSPDILMKSTADCDYLVVNGPTPIKQYSIDLTHSDSFYSETLMNLYTEMLNINANDRTDWISEEVNGAAMVKMDMQFFTDLASVQSTKDGTGKITNLVTPGFDKDGLRYDSLSQQFIAAYSSQTKSDQIKDGFKEWHSAMTDLNTQLLNYMNTNNFKMSTLGNKLIAILNKTIPNGFTIK